MDWKYQYITFYLLYKVKQLSLRTLYNTLLLVDQYTMYSCMLDHFMLFIM